MKGDAPSPHASPASSGGRWIHLHDWLRRERVAADDTFGVFLIVATLTLSFWPIFATPDKFPLHDPIGNDWY